MLIKRTIEETVVSELYKSYLNVDWNRSSDMSCNRFNRITNIRLTRKKEPK